MNVSDMVSTIRTLGIGEVHNDEDSERISLLYLNLAHEQLYRETANINDDILIDEELTSIAGQSYVTLTEYPFLISEIYRDSCHYEMKGLSKRKFNKYKRQNTFNSDPVVYNRKGNVINFHPFIINSTYIFNVSFVPKITKLLMVTPESDIPYPVEYHSVLVDGALYYLFQDESGFKNILKENESKVRWVNGKSSLYSYLYGLNYQEVNTFENT